MIPTALKALTLTLAAGMILFAAACGGDGDDDGDGAGTPSDTPVATAPAADPPDDSEDGDEPEPVTGGGDGVIELNGESIDVTEVRRCEPFSDAEGNLDLTAIGQGVMLFVVVNQTGVSLSHELSLQGASADGVFSASATESGGSWFDQASAPLAGGAPFTVAGDRISGSMTLDDAQGGAETADVAFDIPIPSEIIDCSL